MSRRRSLVRGRERLVGVAEIARFVAVDLWTECFRRPATERAVSDHVRKARSTTRQGTAFRVSDAAVGLLAHASSAQPLEHAEMQWGMLSLAQGLVLGAVVALGFPAATVQVLASPPTAAGERTGAMEPAGEFEV